MYRNMPCNVLERFVISMRLRFSSYDVMASHVPPSGRILDLGCGFGMLSSYLALSSERRVVKGVDISARRIHIARRASRGIGNICFEEGDFLGTDFAGYDCILLIDTLHYFPAPVQDRIIERCCEGMRKMGMILIRDSNRDVKLRHFITGWYETVMTKSGFTKGETLFFRSFRELKGLIESLGFRVFMTPLWGRTPFADTLMVCRKER